MYIGIDSVEIERIKKIHMKYGNKFLNKVFTKLEIEELESKKNSIKYYETLAGKYASKEATLKALSSFDFRFNKILYSQIEILKNNKIPYVKIHIKDLECGNHLNDLINSNNLNERINLSITHDKTNAIAVCIL